MIARRSGFTLIEIMVASAITAMVVFSVLSGFVGVVESKEAHEEAREDSHTAMVILDRLRSEIGSAYLSNLGDTNPDSKAGFTGFFGRHNKRGSDDMDEVQFTTLNHVTLPDVISSDHAEIGYMGEYDDRLKTNVLFHREDQTPDFEFDDGGASFLMASGIKSFSLRYYDGENSEWRSEWDAARNNNMLPMLVRAEIRYETKRGRQMTYSAVVKVHQAYQFIKKQRQQNSQGQ